MAAIYRLLQYIGVEIYLIELLFHFRHNILQVYVHYYKYK